MILYFSGTGNSGYAARRIADGLGEPLLCLNDRIKAGNTAPVETGERLIVVTPTYAWRIPRIVRDWLLKTDLLDARQAWFVMTCGSEIGNAAKFNRELCQAKGLAYRGTAQIIMPENYIAMFNAPQADEARKIVANAEPSIEHAIAAIRAERHFASPRSNLYDRFMSSAVNPIFYPLFCQIRCLYSEQQMRRLRSMRQSLPDEQHRAQGRQTFLGQGLHPLHGLHLLLPRRGH